MRRSNILNSIGVSFTGLPSTKTSTCNGYRRFYRNRRRFIRISKSIVVNIYRVRKIKADVNMKMQLVLDNGEKVILNRSYKNDFLQFIRERRNEHATH